jgi:hypothetical protein
MWTNFAAVPVIYSGAAPTTFHVGEADLLLKTPIAPHDFAYMLTWLADEAVQPEAFMVIDAPRYRPLLRFPSIERATDFRLRFGDATLSVEDYRIRRSKVS